MTYQDDLIPNPPLKVRLNASNDYEDELRVDSLTVRDSTGSTLLHEEFSSLCAETWRVAKGSSAVNCQNWLILQSTGTRAAEVQSTEEFRFRELELTASSQNWSRDTTLGFENWDEDGRHSIIITEGMLKIIGSSVEQTSPIAGWEAVQDGDVTFRLVWEPGMARLFVNGEASPAATIESGKVPSRSLRLRFNASADAPDELTIGKVYVR